MKCSNALQRVYKGFGIYLIFAGDSNKVDLVVGDIYGTDYNKVGLAADVIASRYVGKLFVAV